MSKNNLENTLDPDEPPSLVGDESESDQLSILDQYDVINYVPSSQITETLSVDSANDGLYGIYSNDVVDNTDILDISDFKKALSPLEKALKEVQETPEILEVSSNVLENAKSLNLIETLGEGINDFFKPIAILLKDLYLVPNRVIEIYKTADMKLRDNYKHLAPVMY